MTHSLTQLQEKISEEISGIKDHSLGNFIPLIIPVDRSIYTKTKSEKELLRKIKLALK